MAYPAPKVEIAFDDGPYVASPTWTDITSYVRSMSTDRGRSDDWGDFYGSASVTLDNRTRLFDPFYTSGAYYGKLLPRRQIRITATYGATSYPVFRGYIAGWPPVWTEAGKDSTVTLSCMDAMGLLQSDSLPADWSRDYILSLSPRHYYPCDEPITSFTSNTLRDLGSFPQTMTVTNGTIGSELAVGLPSVSVQMESATTTLVSSTINTSFTITTWQNYNPGNTFYIGNYFVNLYFDDSLGKYVVTISNNTTLAIRSYESNTTFEAGAPFNLACTYDISTSAFQMYLNGVAIGSTLSTFTFVGALFREGIELSRGEYQQVVVFHSILTAAQIQQIYNLSIANFPETTAARFTRLIGLSSFPAALTSPPSSPASNVLDLTDDAPTLTSELQKNADSEYAPLFVDRSGVLTLYNQNQIRSQTRSIISQGTYGAGGIAIGPDVAIAYDGDSMRNQANVTMSQGGVYIGENTTSISTYGAAQESLDTEVASTANAQQIGNIVSGWGGQVYPKADPFEVVLSPNADWSNALDRELNDRITLVVQPPTGNAISNPMLVSRISHSVVPGEWRTTFEGSARWAAVFILNQSRLNGTDLLG